MGRTKRKIIKNKRRKFDGEGATITKKILETNVVIDYLRGNDSHIDINVKTLISQGVDLVITQITSCELWYGVYSMKSRQKQITEAKKMIKFVLNLPEILTLTNESSKIYGEISAELERNGSRVPQFDLLNASIAIANKISLITKEQKHFLQIKEFSEFDFLELWE